MEKSLMTNTRGEVITLILIALIAAGILIGGLIASIDIPCDPTIQHCLDGKK